MRCKYQKVENQVSYDSGATWITVSTEKGNLIETSSFDCPEDAYIERWVLVDGDYICDDKNKYKKEVYQISTDDGLTWYFTTPIVYRKGDFVGVDEVWCDLKFEGHYVATGIRVMKDPIKIVKYDGNPILTSEDTRYYNGGAVRIGNDYYYVSLSSCTIYDVVTSIGDNAFSGCSILSSVTIPSGVTSIGNSAFQGCSSLSSITIPSGVTSIGNSAFQGCSSLPSIIIPDNTSSIGSYAFAYCSDLTNATIGSGVTSIGSYAFRHCDSLSSATFNGGTIKSNTFAQCSGLTNVTINSGIIDDYAFDNYVITPEYGIPYYSNIKTVTIGSGVTSIGDYAFRNCSGITSPIVIPDSVTSIGYEAFTNCSLLNEVTIGSGVTSIGNEAFQGCSGLTSVTIKSGSIGNKAFDGCSLSYVTLGNGVTSIGSEAFKGNYISSITIPSGVTSIGDNAFERCDYLNYATIKSGSIGSSAFYRCESLIDVEIGSGVTSIGGQAFYYCRSLTSLTVPDSVTSIGGYAFAYCSGLTSITIGSGVTSIGGAAFEKCNSLTSVTFNAQCAIEGFNDNSSIKTVIIGDNVPSIGYQAFQYCSGLTSVTIGSGVTSIGESAFVNCTGLTSVNIPSSVTSIGDAAFRGCGNLKTIVCRSITPPTLGGNYSFSNTNISAGGIYVPYESLSAYKTAYRWRNYANFIKPYFMSAKWFAKYAGGTTSSAACDSSSAITAGEITLNNLVYAELGNCNSFRSIGNNAFENCGTLSAVTISDRVTRIGTEAFYNCTGLTSITIFAPNPPSLEIRTFDNTNNCPIYVPSNYVNTYKNYQYDNWPNYTSRIQAIP